MMRPELMLAAWEHIAHSASPEMVHVREERLASDGTSRGSRLVGLFPIYRRVSYRGTRTVGAALWLPTYVGLGTPLIHGECPVETLHMFYDWLLESAGIRHFHWPLYHAEGPFAKALYECMAQRDLAYSITRQFTRRIFVRDEDFETYFQHAMSYDRRRTARRLARRLAEQGEVRFEVMQHPEETDDWIDDFIRIEKSTWKSRAGNAIADSEDHPAYYRQAVRAAQTNGNLRFSALCVDGQRIAMFCCLHDRGEGGGFMITYDEAWRKYSPGLQLLVEFSRHAHDTDLTHCDSCSDDNLSIAEFVWDGSRTIQSCWTSTGGVFGHLGVGLVQTLRVGERGIVSRFRDAYRRRKFAGAKETN